MTVKILEEFCTDAVTSDVAICVKFKPTTPEAGTLVSPAPSPWKDPEKEPE